MSINNIVDLAITIANPVVTRQGFGTALLLSSEAVGKFPGASKAYSSVTELTDDGFLTSGITYKMASKLLAQNPAPSQFKVGKRNSSAAHYLQEIEIKVQNGYEGDRYSVTVNGTKASYIRLNTDTNDDVATALSTSITSANYAVSVLGDTVTLTANTTGYVGSVDSPERVSINEITAIPDGYVTQDLADIFAFDPDFYIVLSDRNTFDEITEIADWTESNRRLLFCETSDPGCLDAGETTDIMSFLKNGAYANTLIVWSDSPNSGIAAAWCGKGISTEPGNYNWAHKSLAGVQAANISNGQQNVITSKRGNYYTIVAGSGHTWNGITPSGEYIDTISLVHFLYARITEDVVAAFKANVRIPYTNSGIAILTSVIGARLNSKIGSGLAADPAPVVTAPRVSEIAAADKQARHLPNVKFVALLDGAINSINIRGTVTVDETVFQNA